MVRGRRHHAIRLGDPLAVAESAVTRRAVNRVTLSSRAPSAFRQSSDPAEIRVRTPPSRSCRDRGNRPREEALIRLNRSPSAARRRREAAVGTPVCEELRLGLRLVTSPGGPCRKHLDRRLRGTPPAEARDRNRQHDEKGGHVIGVAHPVSPPVPRSPARQRPRGAPSWPRIVLRIARLDHDEKTGRRLRACSEPASSPRDSASEGGSAEHADDRRKRSEQDCHS